MANITPPLTKQPPCLSLTPKNISVVVQGEIIPKQTKRLLKSIRKYLYGSEIILSTWEGENLKDLEYDKVILSKDPNTFHVNWGSQTYNININRMILSTKVGIENASHQYILKIRSDCILKNKNFLKYFDKYPYVNPKYQVFHHKIIAYSIYSYRLETNDKNQQMQHAFFVSDMVYFGKKNDIINLFSCPLVIKEDYIDYFKTHKKNEIDIFPERMWRMSPEQYIISQLVTKYFPEITFEHNTDYNEEKLKFSHNFIMNNFIFLDVEHWGIYLQKKAHIAIFRYKLSDVSAKCIYRKYNFCKWYSEIFNTPKRFSEMIDTYTLRRFFIKPFIK